MDGCHGIEEIVRVELFRAILKFDSIESTHANKMGIVVGIEF